MIHTFPDLKSVSLLNSFAMLIDIVKALDEDLKLCLAQNHDEKIVQEALFIRSGLLLILTFWREDVLSRFDVDDRDSICPLNHQEIDFFERKLIKTLEKLKMTVGFVHFEAVSQENMPYITQTALLYTKSSLQILQNSWAFRHQILHLKLPPIQPEGLQRTASAMKDQLQEKA
jgi:hypothetical protein